MSACLIMGHDPVRMPGVGDYAGHEFDVCQRCGVTIFKPGKFGAVATSLQSDAHDCEARDAYSPATPSVLSRRQVNPGDRASINGEIAGTCVNDGEGEA